MTVEPDYGGLGYDLGYLRHGSIGPGLLAMVRRAAARGAGCDGRTYPLSIPNRPRRLPVSPVDPGVQCHFAVLAS
jgi:hypothetical protein